MRVYNKELDQLYDQFVNHRELVKYIEKLFPGYLMDMELNWRSKQIYRNTFRSLNELGKQIVWC